MIGAILSGGYGRRLKPITNEIPKPSLYFTMSGRIKPLPDVTLMIDSLPTFNTQISSVKMPRILPCFVYPVSVFLPDRLKILFTVNAHPENVFYI